MLFDNNHQPLRGVFPIAPTPFADNGALDLPGQRRVLDCMIDQDVDGICILANYSEQFLLSDAERELLPRNRAAQRLLQQPCGLVRA